MSCCGGECSCGKNKSSEKEESFSLVQLTGSGGVNPAFDLSGSLNRLVVELELVELRFKNGRKAFFKNTAGLELSKDDFIVVESGDGYDLGSVSLSGKNARKLFDQKGGDQSVLRKVYRKASSSDIESWLSAKKREYGVLQEARKIASKMSLEMKVDDVDFSGDGLRVNIFYTSSGRVDLRILMRKYTSAFKVKVDMKQMGVRQNDAAFTSANTLVKEGKVEHN